MKPFIIVLSIMTLFTACTKHVDTQSVNAPIISNEAVLHENYSYTLPLSYTDVSFCSNEEIAVTGEVEIRGKYLVNNGKIHFKGTTKYKNMRGIGLVTGNAYKIDISVTDQSTVDVEGSTASPQGTFSLRGKFVTKSPSNSTAVTIFDFKWTVDFNTMVYVYQKADVISYCK